ncbi:spondin domain-containing protein [uncultured Winogradskyella sp.]|uniref:T9SS type A sorting domain-containing protein n=1 Tax=uncultured Winogradskyella sp. TaxID=395353 RepID=UPI0026024221|nr:spondin domain-containing protein [uncultured Winogradskyella sp.]
MKKITLIGLIPLAFLFSISTQAQSTATYDINFTSTWNSSDHGTLPSNAHWSDLVGANHNSNITFLELGGTATTGIENVAETGSNTAFNSEVQSAIINGEAEQWLQQSFSPFAAISSATLSDITVSQDFPLLTLVSMIAPSPDWIIAVNNLDLWDQNLNKWRETFTVDLFPYDAGTEDGFGYSINNPETNPQGVITNIAGVSGYPFNSAKIGTLTITFKSTTLSTNDFASTNEVRIFPNPTNTGKITVTNSNSLDQITIYDILGKNVKQLDNINNKDNTIINVSDLNKGIYIVRLKNISGNTESKKLIIN